MEESKEAHCSTLVIHYENFSQEPRAPFSLPVPFSGGRPVLFLSNEVGRNSAASQSDHSHAATPGRSETIIRLIVPCVTTLNLSVKG